MIFDTKVLLHHRKPAINTRANSNSLFHFAHVLSLEQLKLHHNETDVCMNHYAKCTS